MHEKVATITDIARAAGVSPSTVSRVLNGQVPVAASKREAVLTAVERLGYRPNLVAQGLVRRRSHTVGVLTQSISSPFYGAVLMGIEQGLAGSPYSPLFVSGNRSSQGESEALETLLQRQVDALIVLGPVLAEEELHAAAERMPLVVVCHTVAGLEEHCLRVDNREAARAATKALIELGHTRIAHITGLLAHGDARERLAGYEEALAEAGLPAAPELVVEGQFTEQSGLLAVEMLLARGAGFTAIFAANDQTAYGARLALFRRGIRVPDDVSLVGFDDLLDSAYTTPPLTTVRQPTVAMGAAAAQAVLDLLDGQPLDLPPFHASLVVRESTALRR